MGAPGVNRTLNTVMLWSFVCLSSGIDRDDTCRPPQQPSRTPTTVTGQRFRPPMCLLPHNHRGVEPCSPVEYRRPSAVATLADNPTADDFATLLPVTLDMSDLHGLEKPGTLPRALNRSGAAVFTYEVGQIGYWARAGHWP